MHSIVIYLKCRCLSKVIHQTYRTWTVAPFSNFSAKILVGFCLKVACRVQIWKKGILSKLWQVWLQFYLKWYYIYVHTLYLPKNHYFNPFLKIDTLKFTIYVLTILTSPLKTYVFRLHDLISMNIFLTERSLFFFIIVKRQPKTNKLLKQKNNQKQPFADIFQNRFS